MTIEKSEDRLYTTAYIAEQCNIPLYFLIIFLHAIGWMHRTMDRDGNLVRLEAGPKMAKKGWVVYKFFHVMGNDGPRELLAFLWTEKGAKAVTTMIKIVKATCFHHIH